jgi:hypothetical protein
MESNRRKEENDRRKDKAMRQLATENAALLKRATAAEGMLAEQGEPADPDQMDMSHPALNYINPKTGKRYRIRRIVSGGPEYNALQAKRRPTVPAPPNGPDRSSGAPC